MILMLEDNAERIARFRVAIQTLTQKPDIKIWRNAWQMIQELSAYWDHSTLISLDHDLEPENQSDPGKGWDVVQYVVKHSTRKPVIVHSSNGERSSWMMGEFQLHQWPCHRIAPLGDDWIEIDWTRRVERILRKGRQGVT